MNPKITITVDATKAKVTSTEGMLTVGAKVDVEVRGILPDDVPAYGPDDRFSGKSLRFRIVDSCGRDLARFPLVEKDEDAGDSGDTWTVDGSVFSNTSDRPLNLDTNFLRREFRCVPFNESLEFGLILDSIVDDAQYAVGKVKVRQWSACPTEDPTILPDWRGVVRKVLDAADDAMESKEDADIAADMASGYASDAQESKLLSEQYANAALGHSNTAAGHASNASSSAASSASSAEDAAGSAMAAEEYSSHYPRIDAEMKRWLVWDSTDQGYVDTGVLAEGVSPHIGENGNWFVGTVDTGVRAKGPKGDDGAPGVGVPSGGTAGKVLAKKSDADYDFEWVENRGGGGTSDYNDLDNKPKINGVELSGDMSSDSLGIKSGMKQLPKYLNELSFDSVYLADARAWYASHANDNLGGCSAVRKVGLLGRNYDWNYDEMAEFVVRVSAAKGANEDGSDRHASVGVANVRTGLTEAIVNSGEYSPLYRVLPGRTVDGINDAGVVAEVNVIPRDTTKDPVQSEVRNLHAFEVVRHVLDHYASAAEAAAYVAAHYYIPDGDYSYHWMIADANGNYIVEDGEVIDTETTMTNYRVGVSDDPYGNGYARRTILGGTGTVAELLEAVKFTNAYGNGWPWPDEFAAVGVGTHGETDALKAWADEHVTPLLDEERKPKARGNGCWQTVHSSIYDFAAKTLSISVQEDFSERYVFSCQPSVVQKSVEIPQLGDNPTVGEVAAAVSAMASAFNPNSNGGV